MRIIEEIYIKLSSQMKLQLGSTITEQREISGGWNHEQKTKLTY